MKVSVRQGDAKNIFPYNMSNFRMYLPSHFSWTDCTLPNTRYGGNHKPPESSDSAEDCQDKCYIDQLCTHYVWVDNNWPLGDKCYLYSNLPTKTNVAGFFSGLRMWKEMGMNLSLFVWA